MKKINCQRIVQNFWDGVLVSPYELKPESKVIEAAQPFTVSMVTVVVSEDLDGILRGRNDILVLTKSSLGEQPLVERIHYYEEEVPKGKPIRNMFEKRGKIGKIGDRPRFRKACLV